MTSSLQQAINDKALIITATRRLAMQLQENIARDFAVKKACIAPPIHSQADWLKNLWEQLEASGLTRSKQLISSLQQELIWKQIIESSTRGERLLRLQATSKQVSSGWALLKQWGLTLDALQDAQTEETQLFVEWASLFEQRQAEQNTITEVELPDIISELLTNAQLPILDSFSPNKQLLLLGFEDIVPQFKSFYQQLESLGWQVSEYKPSQEHASILVKHAFYDQATELRAASEWALDIAKNNSKAGSIGIVVPDLAQSRQLVEQTLIETLEPEQELQSEKTMSRRFNISVAEGLGTYPVISAALHALELLDKTLSLQTITYLLRSPFIAQGQTEFKFRALVEYAIKSTAKAHFTLSHILQLTDSVQHQFPDQTNWLMLLQDVSSFKQQLPSKLPVSNWAKLIKQFLALIDWPGERALNSLEHQAVGRFEIMLEEFASLDAIVGDLNLRSAKQLLFQLGLETPFQPQSHKVPIHVMGILEASSQPFEHLWVTGLHNEAWPPIPKPNAFLPHALQREYEMPHASSERELYFAEKLTQNLKSACDDVVFSYYQNDNTKTFEPSDLIADVPECIEPIALQAPRAIAKQLAHKATLEQVQDDKAPEVSQDEIIKGGTSLIQAQSSCPFKAFARYRLHADLLPEPEVGLNAMERGVLVHKILEKTWQQIKTQSTLKELTSEELSELLSSVISFEITAIERLYPELSKGFWEVEAWRLQRILTAWLAIEKQRPPFTIQDQEKAVKLNLNGLDLKMRFDRVDLDEDNNLIIIDYKTSVSTISDCFGERPFAPQLPLYSIANQNESPNGVVFAELRAQGCRFVGVTEMPESLPGVRSLPEIKGEDIPETWQDLLTSWKSVLKNLAQEFKDGVATVTPSKVKSCQQCHLQQLCRINTLSE